MTEVRRGFCCIRELFFNSGAELLEILRDSPGMLVIRRLEKLGRFFSTADRAGGEHLRRMPGPGEAFGDLGLDGVDDQTAADSRAGSGVSSK